ncbi:S26 family signal peptidase [Streptomyces sp. NPDC006658]|uniref:S26 family signal peptidase n=1 Tax=Streptomyces sp. NPDC006658 TaxID=3156900 RepID=UPI003404DB39
MNRAVLALALGGLAVAALSAAARRMRRSLVSVTVRGRSMEPTYHDGDRVLVRRGGPLARGRVVVVERLPFEARRPAPPGQPGPGPTWLIKRVAAVPGDPVPRALGPALAAAPQDLVPPGGLVLLGDNPDVSQDSRRMGFFPADAVLGVVVRSRRAGGGDPASRAHATGFSPPARGGRRPLPPRTGWRRRVSP